MSRLWSSILPLASQHCHFDVNFAIERHWLLVRVTGPPDSVSPPSPPRGRLGFPMAHVLSRFDRLCMTRFDPGCFSASLEDGCMGDRPIRGGVRTTGYPGCP
eukprot:gene24610-biopygen17931